VLKVTAIRALPPPYDASAHASLVAAVHDALLHTTDSSTDALGVRSFALKFSPVSVTEAPLVGAMFDGSTLVTTGASKVKSTDDVPTTLLTVTTGRAFAPDPPAKPQARIVSATHDVVVHVHAPDVSTDTVGLTLK
jgi:hypothetical protein